MTQLNVITICGSLRKASFNAALARQLPKLAPAAMTITAGPSIETLPLFNQDVLDVAVPQPVEALAAAMRAADGVIIVSPEYNWSMPGPLKNAIDWLSKVKNQPFEGKPIAIQSAAPGQLGGARMQYHLRQALTSIGAEMLVRPEIFVNLAAEKFAKDTLELTDQPTIDIIKLQLGNFEKFIRRMTGKA
jgi:chromate reductase, NAD(P)H dehydrogenase (quinone)